MPEHRVADTFWGKIIIGPERPLERSASMDVGLQSLQQKDYSKAARSFRVAVRESEKETLVRAEALWGAGTAELLCGNVERSLECLKRSVLINPDSLEASINLGVALIRDRRGEQAVDLFRKASSLNPCLAMIQYNMGIAFEGARNLEAAFHAFEQATHYDPNMSDAFTSLGNLHLMKEEYLLAIEAFRKALDVDPDCEHAKKGLYMAMREQEVLEGDNLHNEQTPKPTLKSRIWRAIRRLRPGRRSPFTEE